MYFSGENPIGKMFSDMEASPPRWTQVIGVVEDAKLNSLRKPAPPLIYLPYPVDGVEDWMSLEIRARVDVASIASALRRITNSAFVVSTITTQSKLVDDTLLRERLLAKIGSFFGVLALVLAAVGLYGIMSYAVARRTSEFGIRMALGATRGAVLGMVLRDSLRIFIAGATIGVAAALGMTRFVASLLFGVSTRDPLAIAISIFVLAAIAFAAAFLPAYKAARTDPTTALRYE
jgi:ABC-type antimicrobial peptide transport system permease subunit